MARQHPLLLRFMSLLHKAARSRLSSAQGPPAPLAPLPLTSFCTILEARIFSMILASSSGGSWGQESRGLFSQLTAWPPAPSQRRRAACSPASPPEPAQRALGEPRCGHPCWVRGCGRRQSSYTRPPPVLPRPARPPHRRVWLCGSFQLDQGGRRGWEVSQERGGGLGASAPRLKEENTHVSCSQPLSMPHLHLPWHLYNPVMLDGPRAPAEQGAGLSGPATSILHCCCLPTAAGHSHQPLSPTAVHAAPPSLRQL